MARLLPLQSCRRAMSLFGTFVRAGCLASIVFAIGSFTASKLNRPVKFCHGNLFPSLAWGSMIGALGVGEVI